MRPSSMLCLVALCSSSVALLACRGAYDAAFVVTSASSGEPIPGAHIDVTYPQRRFLTPGDRTLETDETGQTTATIRRWPFMVLEVDEAGYEPYRVGVYRRLDAWETRALPVVQGAEPGEAPSALPVVFPAVDTDTQGERVFEIPLNWDARPTIRFDLPADYEGVLLLEKMGNEPELPEAPAPRLFDVDPEDRAIVPIPSWPESEVPYVLYRFERDGRALPPYALSPGGDAARVIRDLEDSLLVVIGPEQAHRAMLELLWDEDIIEHRLVWNDDVFDEMMLLLEQTGGPITARQITDALGEPYWSDQPTRSGSSRMAY